MDDLYGDIVAPSSDSQKPADVEYDPEMIYPAEDAGPAPKALEKPPVDKIEGLPTEAIASPTLVFVADG